MEPLINILTRTSNRPKGFLKCRESIVNQTYKNINHIVVTDDIKSIDYIESSGVQEYTLIDKEDLIKKDNTINNNPQTGRLSVHNLYCNVLNSMVKDGYIMYLDDDDMLLNNTSIENIVNNIVDSDTILFWQMRYPTGRVLPVRGFHIKKPIIGDIGSPCFLFHHKWVEYAVWDTWKCSDFRVVSNLDKHIPNKKWISHPFIQLNNNGDLGRRNDI